MLPALTRHLIVPLHERLLRRSTLPCAAELEQSQWLAPDDLRTMQETKLRSLLRHAAANTSFYRDRIASADVDPDRQDPFDALRQMPLLNKSDIRRSIDRMLWRDAPGGLHRGCTGGSTGEPLTFYLDRRRQAYDQAARIRSHRWFNVNLGEREVYVWGSPIEPARTGALKRWRDTCFNHRLLSAFDMSPKRMDKYLDAIARYRPACLFGYPSSLALLADHARSTGRRLDRGGLRAVFVTGEVCYPHQRESIASVTDAPIANGYGSREGGFVAHECPDGNLHLTAENIVVEIVDQDGEPVTDESPGEIILTHLDAYAMPFIRYRTGDIGRRKPGRCRCGRGLPMIDVVHGRSTDFLYLPDGTIKHALSIIYPLRELHGLRRFQVTQHEDYAVTIDVVADDRRDRITHETVVNGVRPVIGNDVALTVRFVPHIAAAASGKHRYVISHAPPSRKASAVEALPHA